ncbi:MAG: hypothetical protein VZR53_12055 [Prevotella sp.]|nr:hypothetical protein [Prevotella sp.]
MKINSLKFNNSTIHKMYHGNELVNKIGDAFTYMEASGDTPTPPTPVPYSGQYLTIESLNDNNTITWKASYAGGLTISASTDNGSTWTEYTSSFYGTPIATLNTGDKVLVKGTNEAYAISNSGNNRFLTNENFIVYGNIMSLISGDTFVNADTLTTAYTFANLFRDATGLTSASNLILPATTLANNCYYQMFYGCTSLLAAPSILPATTLATACYHEMFRGCRNLTTAPVLPARMLINSCYQNMFNGCTSLNYIKCLATILAANNCTYRWVNNVSASGTFVKAASMSSWATGANGIPTGWTVQNDR